jgi:hypothetical protein
MKLRRWLLTALVLAAPLLASCATLGLTPEEDSMPAARSALAPEYRLFYDALQDYGDWTLIEPYGYVFRPYNNVVGWRPYSSGYWAASDSYGWVWISAEPFGWATYHYGTWMYDRFQGWVWIPGTDWAPAWVTWDQSASTDYVGWSPLSPTGTSYSTNLVPGGSYLYVPTAALASTNVASQAQTSEQLGEKLGAVEPIQNVLVRGGVRFNAGPQFDLVERRAGSLPRVRIEDALPAGSLAGSAGRARPVSPGLQRPGAAGADTTFDAMRRAAEESARSARELAGHKSGPPAQVQVVRPSVREFGQQERARTTPAPGKATRERPRRERAQGAAPDSAGRR